MPSDHTESSMHAKASASHGMDAPCRNSRKPAREKSFDCEEIAQTVHAAISTNSSDHSASRFAFNPPGCVRARSARSI